MWDLLAVAASSSQPDLVQYITLGAAVVAAFGAVWAATVTNRAAFQAWRRDHLLPLIAEFLQLSEDQEAAMEEWARQDTARAAYVARVEEEAESLTFPGVSISEIEVHAMEAAVTTEVVAIKAKAEAQAAQIDANLRAATLLRQRILLVASPDVQRGTDVVVKNLVLFWKQRSGESDVADVDELLHRAELALMAVTREDLGLHYSRFFRWRRRHLSMPGYTPEPLSLQSIPPGDGDND